MRRALTMVCLATLLLGAGGCRRSTPAKKDTHLEAGYALLLRAPAEARAHFERSPDRSGAKEYALGQAYEALGSLDQARAHYESALGERPGFIKAETARARIDLLEGRADAAAARLATVAAKAPTELPALLLWGVAARTPADRERAAAALRGWPQQDKPGAAPAEYYLVLAGLQRRLDPALPLEELARRAEQAPLYTVAGAIVLAKLALLNDHPWLASALLVRTAREKLPSRDAADLATLALTSGDLRLAQAAARSIQPFPEEAKSQLALGQVELAAGEAARAIKYLKTGLSLLPTDASAARSQGEALLAQAYLEQKDPERAAPLILGLVARDPKNLPAQVLFAQLEVQRGEPARAALHLERLRAEHPRAPAVENELVRARLAAGDRDGAVQVARERCLEAPNDRAALAALIGLLLELDRGDDAARELERAVAARPKDEGLWVLWLQTTERLGRPDALRGILRRFVVEHPTSETAWLSLARLEEREHHPEAVRLALESALRAHPKSTTALSHLAELSLREHKWAEAAATYEQVVTLVPNDANALNNLGYLYADRLDKADRAVAFAERAHQLVLDRPVIEDTLGWALIRRGKPEDRARALALLQHARELLPQEDVRLHLAVACHLQGQSDRSRELLAGFRFRPDDPGHVFARATLATTP